MSKALLVDVGGTNIRYAIANNLDEDISDINKSSFNEKNFENLLQKLIKDNNIDTLIVSIAGPKLNNSITMTNRNYTFNSDRIKSKFNLQECIILNDWEAIAHSFNFISKDIRYIKKGSKFNDTKLFLGPGTGLGAALSIGNQIVLPTEIGNTTNSNSYLHKNYDIELDKNSVLENLVSGSALSSIYESKTNLKISSEEVFEKFNAKDHVANKVIDGFIKSLAETLSDLALTFLPGDEILLAGSLIRSLFPIINQKDFTKAFIGTKNGIHKELLEKISIGVIMKEKTPLYGNFNLFKNLN